MSKNKSKVEESVLTSLGMYQLPNMGSDSWIVVEVKTKDGIVISTKQLDIPNSRQAAHTTLKIAVVKQFFN